MMVKRFAYTTFLTFLIMTGAGQLRAAEVLQGVRLLTPSAEQYEKIEIALRPDRVPDNPFNPHEVSLDAIIRTPSGKLLKVPGFWYQAYERTLQNPQAEGIKRIEVLTKTGDPEWRVRFAGREAGEYHFILQLKDQTGLYRSPEQSFQVTTGAGKGYIRVSSRNQQYLEYESGDSFFPIGENLCMYQDKEGTYYYDRLLKELADAGANYVRLWQEYYVPHDLSIVAGPGDAGFTGFPLETQQTGLGRYDLASAWRLDYVVGVCDELNIFWQLASEMVVWWEPRQTHLWSRNPYNAANGGPCVNPSDYFTDPEARDLVKRRLRYNVARWGWNTHLAAWELWNEVDNLSGFTSKANTAWHREMAGFLKEIDPWQHMITTSWRDPNMFALPNIDIVQAHSYFDAEYDAATYSLQDTDHLMRGFGKPFFFGEQGLGGSVKVDPEGKHFHDTLWATVMSGAAGTGLYWWWHNYIEPFDLYHHFTPVAKFVENIDWPAHDWKEIRLSRPNLPETLNVYGLTTEDEALVWIHDPLAFRVVDEKGVKGPFQSSASVNIVGLADGAYQIQWVDTSSGEVIRTDDGNVRHLRHFGYGLELTPPEFWGDIAAKIFRKK